jgi:hypothetical protein
MTNPMTELIKRQVWDQIDRQVYRQVYRQLINGATR